MAHGTSPPARHREHHWTGIPLAARLLRRRRVLLYLALGLAGVVAVHLLGPRLAGLEDSLRALRRGRPGPLVLAGALTVVLYGSAVLLFGALTRDVPGRARERLGPRAWVGAAFGGQAASTVLSAGGAGAIAIMAWALRAARLGGRCAVARPSPSSRWPTGGPRSPRSAPAWPPSAPGSARPR